MGLSENEQRWTSAAGRLRLLVSLCAAVALGALVSLVLVAAPAGAGQSGVPKAEVKRFEVKINGRVVTRWSQDVAQEGCNSGASGSGDRSVEFSMERPAPLVAVKFPGSKGVFLYRRFKGFDNLREAEYTLDAKISQQGSMTFTPPPESSGCPVFDGGGGEPIPPDCGARTHVSEILLESSRDEGRGFRWEESTLEDIQAFIDSSRGYTNCTYLGPRFQVFPSRDTQRPQRPTYLFPKGLDKGENILDLDKPIDVHSNFDVTTPIEGGSAVTTAFLRYQIIPKGK